MYLKGNQDEKIGNFHSLRLNRKPACCCSPSPPYTHRIFANMLGDVIFCENVFLVTKEDNICPKT